MTSPILFLPLDTVAFDEATPFLTGQITYTNSLLGGTFQVEAPINPPAPATRREVYTPLLVERGIRPLAEHEVVDTGDYFLFNNYDGSETILLESGNNVVSEFDTLTQIRAHWGDEVGVRERLANRLAAIPDNRRVRVKSPLLVYQNDGEVVAMKYVVAYDGRQRRVSWTSRSGIRTTSVGNATSRLPDGAQRIPFGQAPDQLRWDYMNYLAGSLYDRNAITHTRWEQVHAGVNNRRDTSRMIPLRITYRGVLLSESAYKRTRETLKRIGELVRDAMHTGTDELMEELGSLPGNVQESIKRNVVEAWNKVADFEEMMVASCGHVCPADETESTHDGHVCQSCYEDNYVWVEDSEDYRHRDRVYAHDDGNYYTYEEEDEDEDEDDEDESANGHICSYSTNVLRYRSVDHDLVVSPYGEFYMGVELEVMPLEGHRGQAARDTAQGLCEDYAILKNDGSLGARSRYADGFEIVTAPRGLKEHIKRFQEWVPHPQLRAWDTGKCGLHVHLSSQAFSATTLGKFIEFINARTNDGMILEIAGRHPTRDRQAEDYCQREGSLSLGNPKKTIAGKSTSRYFMVNTTNLDYDETQRLGLDSDHAQKNINTIELRIFKASLSKPRLLAQIEFAHAAVMFCRWSSMRELTRDHFLTWLRDAAGTYPHLAKWFGVKANKKEIVAAPAVRETAEV